MKKLMRFAVYESSHGGHKMLEDLKAEVCAANKLLVTQGLVLFTWGNVSGIDRDKGIFAIKPSGVPYDTLTPQDVVLIDLNGTVVEGCARPSSDTPTHLELYRSFAELKGICHTHSKYATIFAQAGREIPCLGTTHADYFYGSVPVTRELRSDEVVSEYELNTGKVIRETFKNKKIDARDMRACLVSSHGPFTWGDSANKAVESAATLEFVAQMALETLVMNPRVQAVPQFLLDKHYKRKHGSGAYYGQK